MSRTGLRTTWARSPSQANTTHTLSAEKQITETSSVCVYKNPSSPTPPFFTFYYHNLFGTKHASVYVATKKWESTTHTLSVATKNRNKLCLWCMLEPPLPHPTFYKNIDKLCVCIYDKINKYTMMTNEWINDWMSIQNGWTFKMVEHYNFLWSQLDNVC